MFILALNLMVAAPSAAVLSEADALWANRTPANFSKNAQAVVTKLKPHAKDFEGAWRLARAYCWLSERKPYFKDTKYKARLGSLAMKHAQTAMKTQPKRVEGHYYYAWAVGQWSLGVSIPTALWKGAEGKLRKSMKSAESMNSAYDYYGVYRMWGRFFHSLPWPKHDGAKALKYLSKANARTPKNLRGYFYLAEAQISADQPQKACATVTKALAVKASSSQEPDWKNWRRDLGKLKAAQCKKTLDAL
jgi:hypothetical protein